MKNLILLLTYWVYQDVRDFAIAIKKLRNKKWKQSAMLNINVSAKHNN